MECLEIKRHLSEYIDGVLDADKAAQVEKHLESCADCREELSALERVIQTLGSMEVMEAPEDFMERVHQRIERRSRLSRVWRSLFIPFRLKIPIQVASVVTACVLVFLIFHHMRTAEEVATLVQEPAIQPTAEKAIPPAPAPAKTKKLSRPASRLGKAMPVLEKMARKPIQLILRVSKEDRTLSSHQRKSVPSEKRTMARVAAKRKESSLSEESGAKAPQEAVADNAFFSEADLLEKLMNRWTRDNNGRILHIRNDKATGRPIQFSIEIPAEELPAFLEKLSQIGSLKTHAPPTPDIQQKMVQLDIRLFYGK
ncbi:MAG: DUF2275 domain-containing protein [Deltaproteobacteria bacterium]|nr:DUF2275 domain-containing protein [Deltaproteobacteria bacterium]